MGILLHIWVVHALCINCVVAVSLGATTGADFFISTRCVLNSCSHKEHKEARSETECAAKCLCDNNCAGFLFEHQDSCLLLQDGCVQDAPCTVSGRSSKVFERETNNGFCSAVVGNTCSGGQCQVGPMGCEKLRAQDSAHGIHWTNLDLPPHQRSTTVKCELKPREVLTYIFANNGMMNHTRNYDDYVNGYYLDDDNFWLGLEPMLALNRACHTDVLLSVVLTHPSHSPISYHNQYPCFVMHDQAAKYRFTVGVRKITTYFPASPQGLPIFLPDVLQRCKNRPFHTFDVDNADNCAQKAGSGWWFPDCSGNVNVNLLGILGAITPNLKEDRYFRLFEFDDSKIGDNALAITMAFITEFP